MSLLNFVLKWQMHSVEFLDKNGNSIGGIGGCTNVPWCTDECPYCTKIKPHINYVSPDPLDSVVNLNCTTEELPQLPNPAFCNKHCTR